MGREVKYEDWGHPYVKELSVPTLCKCPMCGKTYTRLLYWRGNGTPRFYCTSCLFTFGDEIKSECLEEHKIIK